MFRTKAKVIRKFVRFEVETKEVCFEIETEINWDCKIEKIPNGLRTVELVAKHGKLKNFVGLCNKFVRNEINVYCLIDYSLYKWIKQLWRKSPYFLSKYCVFLRSLNYIIIICN